MFNNIIINRIIFWFAYGIVPVVSLIFDNFFVYKICKLKKKAKTSEKKLSFGY